MKFEVLPNKKKKITITLLVVGLVTIVGIATFSLTRAKYQYTNSLPLIRANNISYNKSDLEIVAIKLQQDDGTYKDAIEIPSSGYHLNGDISKSYCKVGDTTNIVDYDYYNGELYLKAKEKGSKCYLSFDKGSTINFAKRILEDNGGAINIVKKGNPDFNKTSCTSGTYNGTARTCDEDTTGIWAMEDDYGTSYYFRGTPTNNYVKFGKYASNYSDSSLAGKDMYWRIIRINGDGTIRMIYDGTEYHPNGTSTNNSIARFSLMFNQVYDNINEHVGYTYATGSKRGTGISNYAKTQLDTWYTSSGLSNYSSYLADSGFCGDRTSTTSSSGIPNNTGGTGTITTYYGANYRLKTKKEPTLKCSAINYGEGYESGSKSDVYTVSSTKGNGQLTNPIGLISADEAALAGGKYYSSSSDYNYAYYLYNEQKYWTMSPYYFSGSYAYVWIVSSYGLNYCHVSSYSCAGLRPVINLKSETLKNVNVDANGVYEVS